MSSGVKKRIRPRVSQIEYRLPSTERINENSPLATSQQIILALLKYKQVRSRKHRKTFALSFNTEQAQILAILLEEMIKFELAK